MTTPYDQATGLPQTSSLTSYFFGGAYETRSDGSKFKYYNLAGQTVINEFNPATNSWKLSYPLTDHLGSMVSITDINASMVSQQRYLPFGQVRTDVASPNSQSLITDLGYTGQRNLDEDIGLMDYRARFYSPVLNRFIQPDSIVPGMYNPQILNRFSYVGNNPLNYTDPSGHVSCNHANAAEEGCGDFWTIVEKDYGINFKGDWSNKNKNAVYDAVRKVGIAISRKTDNDIGDAFKQVFGTTTFEWGCSECTKLGRTVDENTIKFRDFYGDHNPQQTLMNINLVIHEIGHMFENTIANILPDGKLYKPARSSLPSDLANNRDGLGAQWIYQHSADISSGEIFADMFVGWVQGDWALGIDGNLTDSARERSNWMNQKMPTFLTMIP